MNLAATSYPWSKNMAPIKASATLAKIYFFVRPPEASSPFDKNKCSPSPKAN